MYKDFVEIWMKFYNHFLFNVIINWFKNYFIIDKSNAICSMISINFM